MKINKKIKEQKTNKVFNFKAIESKWQKEWEKKKAFEVKENIKNKKKKYYVLEMFPYPSGSGLHMGHAFNYSIGDIYSRYKRMNGFNVLYPMGYDSLGLPAENAAIKAGTHPKKYTEVSIKNFIKQQKELGLSYDWKRMIETHNPDYYKWDQWIFLKMLEKGLVYRKISAVNFCKKCDTVLANEQVHNGKCWRHTDTEVKIKQLEQWFIKITDYCDELLDSVDTLDWPEKIKSMQKNWIGKSYGTEIDFEIETKGKKTIWPIFTTRPDTIYGVTFMVASSQHPRLHELITPEQKNEVEKFLNKIKSTSEKDSVEMELEKEGVFTGSYAIHPLTYEKIPVYTGNFVVAEYGGGMVMAVPAHDQRDYAFAKKYNIPLKIVIQPINFELTPQKISEAYTQEGRLINSKQFDNLNNKEAIQKITEYLEKNNIGRRKIQFRLRDWLVSRQRYWGTPIPIIYCKNCGVVPVPEKDLPVKLPEKVIFGKGNPLETNKRFIETTCPKCKGKAKRETDTMDTFVNSSWYYLRYCDNKNKKEIFDRKKVDYWCPIDQYIGGAEHACMHLIYFRFYTKFLRDIGMISFSEPAIKLFNQGMLHGEDGYVMSKSRGNVVLPEEVSKKYGIDTARLFLVSIASPDKDLVWSGKGIEGSSKFVRKLFEYFENIQSKIGKSSEKLESKLHKTIKEYSEDIENFKYNLAVIKIRELFEIIFEEERISKKDLESALKLLHPICPHITEEFFSKLKNKKLLTLESWPVSDKNKINEELLKQDELINKTIEDITNIIKIIENKGKTIKKIFIYVLPHEMSIYQRNKEKISKKINLSLTLYTVNDKDKYDPENKSKNSKPGKPGIYIE